MSQNIHRQFSESNVFPYSYQLTDFGLSKVGLINSTDDLSGPAVSGTSLMDEDEYQISATESQQERRKKRSAVGTPDYLAPEILLGTGHGLYSSEKFSFIYEESRMEYSSHLVQGNFSRQWFPFKSNIMLLSKFLAKKTLACYHFI